MQPQPRILTPDQAIKLAQENIQTSHFIIITTCLGKADVPASFAQVGGGGVTRPDGLSYSQWSNEKGELLILFASLGLFTYVLDFDRMPEGLRQYYLQADNNEREPRNYRAPSCKSRRA